MKRVLFLLLAWGTAALVAAPVPMKGIHGWNTWKRADDGGAFERVKPDEKHPQGAFRFVADSTAKRYSLQAYGHDAARPDQFKRYTVKLTVSPDASAETVVNFLLKAKNKSGSWYNVVKPPITQSLNVVPGTAQQITLEIDLKKFDAPEIAQICPLITVSGLKTGSILIDAIEVETAQSTYTPPAVPQGPGLQGMVIQQGAFKRFAWSGPVGTTKFARMMDFTALGLNIVELTPAARAAAWQWPSGDTIKAEYQNGAWRITAGTAPDQLTAALTVAGDKLTAAACGTGVIFRGADGGNHFVEGGLDAIGMTLLHSAGTAELAVKQLYIADDALALCWIEEARKELRRARALYDNQQEYIKFMWGANSGERRWNTMFAFYSQALDDAFRSANAATDNFAATLLENPVLRDRYNHLIWMSAREFPEEGGYFGGVFRKNWFSKLGGAGPVTQALDFARKVEQLVARARRVAGATFQEGVADDHLLSAGWTSNFEHVPLRAGGTAPLVREWELDMARGEAESAQLVLSCARTPVSGIQITAQASSPAAPPLKIYQTEYVTATEGAAPQLPLCAPGDREIPDVLIPLPADRKLTLGAYHNCALQFDVRAAQNTKPGKYTYKVTIQAENLKPLTLPLNITVRNFELDRKALVNMGGFRPSTFPTWYGKELAPQGRRNLMLEMLDCNMEPLDLYTPTPLDEDLEWAVANGVGAANLGGMLNALAHPEPNMVKFVELYGSADGKSFTKIPAQVSLVPRDKNDPLSDQDVVIVPEKSVAGYRYLKAHYRETRGWFDRVPYSFVILYPALGSAVELTLADGQTAPGRKPVFIQPDAAPADNGLAMAKSAGSFKFDNLRDGANRGSVIFDKGTSEVQSIRLVNRTIEVALTGMRKRHAAIRKIAGDKFPIYLYGFDETAAHLNGRLASALENARRAFPDVTVVSTVGNPDAQESLYAKLDVHCPANVYALPRHNRRMYEKYGTKFWTYVGGGGYYPFGNFERVDQPLVNSRAFFWEPIAFDFITGFLYWDIHMWRNNDALKAMPQLDWSLWNTTHGDNNGMGALFYPGPDATIYPSRRAHAMRDGFEDYAAVKLAAQKIAALPEDRRADAQRKLQTIRDEFSTGMSVFNQTPDQVMKNRHALYNLIDELNK